MAVEVMINGKPVKLGRPPKISAIFEVLSILDDRPLLGSAAALSLAWEAGGSPHPPARWSKCKGPISYGETAFEAIMKLNLGSNAYRGLVQAALEVLTADLPNFQNAEDKAKNSEAGEDQQTS